MDADTPEIVRLWDSAELADEIERLDADPEMIELLDAYRNRPRPIRDFFAQAIRSLKMGRG